MPVNIVSWSGGKDSTAMLYYLLYEKEIENVIVLYVDTGIVVPDTSVYVEELQKDWGFDLRVVFPEKSYFTLLEEKRFFPSIPILWCLRELKKVPINDFLVWVERDTIKNVFVGVRKAESLYRNIHYARKIRVVSRKHKIINIYPILDWSDRDVVTYFQKNKLPVNAGYEKLGISSCYVCPFLHRKYYLRLRREYPCLFDVILKYEKMLGHRVMSENVELASVAQQTFLVGGP